MKYILTTLTGSTRERMKVPRYRFNTIRPANWFLILKIRRRWMAMMLAGIAAALIAFAPAHALEIDAVIVEESDTAFVNPHQVAVDKEGHRYVFGRFQGRVTFGEGRDTFEIEGSDSDLFVAKYNAAGTLVWVEVFETERHGGGLPGASAAGIGIDGTDLYVAGTFRSGLDVGPHRLVSNDANADGFIAQLDAGTGLVRWANQVSGTRTIVVEDLSVGRGIAVITGNFRGISEFVGQFGRSDTLLSLTPNGSDMFVAQYSPVGEFSFALQAGGDGATGHGVHMNRSGAFTVVGDFAGTIRFPDSRNPLELTSAGGNDGFIARYGRGGNMRSVLQVGGPGSDSAHRIAAADRSFKVYVAGSFRDKININGTHLVSRGQNDTYLLRLNSLFGNIERVSRLGSNSIDMLRGMDVDEEGNVHVAGRFFGSQLKVGEPSSPIQLPGNGATAYIAGFNADLIPAFGQVIEGRPNPNRLTVDGAGDVHLAVNYRRAVTFGDEDRSIEIPDPSGFSAMAVARFTLSGDETAP